ncbi:hypothetical protein, partial [Pseudomonas aeruginosa]|uniref:hypothetical protein n=1 Tax=Pseudomonas aeruginosa TaxID=287 RepID=UPI0029CA1E09
MKVMKWSAIALAVSAGSTQGRSEVALYFRSTSALAAFESGPSIKIDQVTRSVLRFGRREHL